MQAGKKIVAGMLALALTIQGVPMQRGTAVQAAGQTTETAPLQGTDGAITWKLTDNGKRRYAWIYAYVRWC